MAIRAQITALCRNLKGKRPVYLILGLAITALLILGLAAAAYKNQSAQRQSESVGGSIPFPAANGLNTDTTPQDTLSQWKDDPGYQSPLTGISYDELFRHSDKYQGKFVHYTGEVVQVLGDSGNWNLRVNITKKGSDTYSYWEDSVLIFSYSPDRVIEKDIIEFTAKANGVTTYKSVLGGEISIPSLVIYEQTVTGRAN